MTEEPPSIPVLNPKLPDGVFDADWYATQNPDVASDELAPWEHFVRYGDSEHRAPGPEFDLDFYARTYLPLEGENAAYHYIIYGRPRAYVTRPVPLGRRESAQAMRAALSRRRYPILLIGSDAQHAGAPILLLEIARRLMVRGFSPVFLLRRGGPLLDAYRSLGPAFVADEGWDLIGLGSALRATTPVFANTGWGALVLDAMQHEGASAVLVHEMTDYLIEHGLLSAVGRAPTVIASMPGLGAELADKLSGHADVRVVRPGLMTQAPHPRARDAVRKVLETTWGTGNTVYVGAGYADARKGFDLFIEAARQIHTRIPQARFVWLGELSAWARSIADSAIDDGIPLLLPGFRGDSTAWYSLADVYLLTSRQDPGPTTVMDAALVGVPFVAYSADIGLRSLGPILDGVGVFVDDNATFVQQAIGFAQTDDDASRRRRATHVARLASFQRYVDDLLGVLRSTSSLDEPPLVFQAVGSRAITVARVLRRTAGRSLRAVLQLVRGTGLPGYQTTTYRPIIGPWMHSPQERRHAPHRPLTLAVSESGSPRGDALRTADEVRALLPGERAWLADVRLLRHVAHPAVVHLVRDRNRPPWQAVAAIEAATHSITTLHQHDDDSPLSRLETHPPRMRSRRVRATRSAQPLVLNAPSAPSSTASIGVFLHAYYLDLAEKIIPLLERIPHPFSLYVSTDDEAKAQHLRARLPHADVRVFSNVGRDIYPKMFGFAPEHAHHDLVLHLHTKRSPHSSILSGWLDHILERLLPSAEGVDAILSLFEAAPALGMVSPTPFPGILPSYRWGATLNIAQTLTFEEQWPLPSDRNLAFPAGSMFWARPAALLPLQDLAVPARAFVHDPSMLDGTLAHAVERLIGVSCSVAGLSHIFVDPPDTAGLSTEEAWRIVSRAGNKPSRRALSVRV